MHIVFESGRARRWIARLVAFAKYSIARPAVSAAAYWARGSRDDDALTADGRPLRPGITYCLVAKNEDAVVGHCLRSLEGFADQVICVDNGSDDATLSTLRQFAASSPQSNVTLLSRPRGTLCELRQEAAANVEHTWFIRGDADMVFLESFRSLKPRLLAMRRPAAVRCRKLDLYGDVRHYNRLFGPISQGEYFMRRYDRRLRYMEYEGRLEHAPLPIHYRMVEPPGLAFLHLDSHKPNERLLYRTCYLDWRQHVNTSSGAGASLPLERYRRLWLRHNLGTEDPLSLRFRMARLIAEQCAPLAPELRSIVDDALIDPTMARFVVEYRDGRPYLRLDTRDAELVGYRPTASDLAWPADPVRFYRDSVRRRFDVA
jgi:hypothetical protein